MELSMLPEICLPLDDDQCPVDDQTLGQMYRASPDGLEQLVATVSPQARAMLAIYCYRRAHLSSIGLAIAAECAKDDLVQTGGAAGAMLFDRSREPPRTVAATPALARRKISLGICAAPLPPFEDAGESEGVEEPGRGTRSLKN
jgi:hypothetical protein